MMKIENYSEKDYLMKTAMKREHFANLLLNVLEQADKPLRVTELVASNEELSHYTVQKTTAWLKHLIVWGYVQVEVIGTEMVRISKNKFVENRITAYSLIR